MPAYIISAILAHPDFGAAFKSLVMPSGVHLNGAYILNAYGGYRNHHYPMGAIFYSRLYC